MELAEKTRKTFRIQPIHNRGSLSSKEKQEYLIEDSGSIILEQEFLHQDHLGNLLNLEKDEIVKCDYCGEVILKKDGIQCCCCGHYYCPCHNPVKILKGRQTVRIIREDKTIEETEHDEIEIYCQPCWRKEHYRRFLQGVFKVVGLICLIPIKPFIAMSQQPQQVIAKTSTIFILISSLLAATLHAQTTVELFSVNKTNGSRKVFYMNNNYQLSKEAENILLASEDIGINKNNKFGKVLCRRIKNGLVKGDVEKEAVESLKKLVERTMEAFKEEFHESLLTFFQPSINDLTPGDFSILKTLFTDIDVDFQFSKLCMGGQNYSSMGYGKSTYHFRLIEKAAAAGLPCVAFAKKKDGFFRKLLRMFPGKTLILKPSDHYYNPFYSIRGDPLDLGYKLMYQQAAYGKYDSQILSIHSLEKFSKEQSLHGEIAPTIDWFLRTIPNLVYEMPKGSVNRSLIPSQLAMYYKMKYSALGQIMACQRGINWKEVFEKKLIVVIDLSDLDDVDEIFITTCLLHDFRITIEENPNIKSVQGAKLFCVIDEADSSISKKWDNTNSSHSSPMGSEIILLRGSEIALAFGGHVPSDCIPGAKANSYYTLIGCLSHGSDVYAGGRAAALKGPQSEAISYFGVGQGVLKEAGKEPILVKWERLPDLTPVTEEERLEANIRILKELSPIIPVKFTQTTEVSTSSKSVSKKLTTQEEKLEVLKHIFKNPFLNISKRSDELYS